MRSRLRPLAAPVGLFAAAVAALFLPSLVSPLVPTQPFDATPEEWTQRTNASYALAAMLVVAALGVAARRLARDERAGTATLATLLVLGVATATAGALPHTDWMAASALEERYEESGAFGSVPGVSLAPIHPAAHVPNLVFLHDTPRGPVPTEAFLEIGEFPVTRGDLWMVHLVSFGPRWDGFEPPRILAPGLACETSVLMDGFGDAGREHHGTVFRCVAQTTGTVRVAIDGRWPGERTSDVMVMATPTAYVVHGSRIDEALVVLGSLAGLGAGTLALAHAGCAAPDARARRRLEALGAFTLAGAALVWAALLQGRAQVAGTAGAPFLLVALAACGVALACGVRWLRAPEGATQGHALLAAGSVALTGVASLPVLASSMYPWTHPMPALLGAAATTLVLSAAAGARWWRVAQPAADGAAQDA